MRWIALSCLLLTLLCCQKENDRLAPVYYPELMEIPEGFPQVQMPDGNEFTIPRWELGKRLFFDTALSLDSSISCGSCHQPALAFSDDKALSQGVNNRIGTRNSSPLFNVAYHPYFTREGGVPTLEMQVLVPVQEHNEFDFNIVLIVDRLNTDSLYKTMARKAYNREIDAFTITRALACFERSFLSGNSLYDQYLNKDNTNAMTAAALRGMDLFFNEKTNCSKCHSDHNFTNYSFENNGLYKEYPDPGRWRLTGEASDKALFKVPSLRNIALTAPYMHDGSFNTLEEIIDHYQSGGKDHPNKSHLIKPFELSDEEQTDLIQFLKSLTDESFINNPLFKNQQ